MSVGLETWTLVGSHGRMGEVRGIVAVMVLVARMVPHERWSRKASEALLLLKRMVDGMKKPSRQQGRGERQGEQLILSALRVLSWSMSAFRQE